MSKNILHKYDPDSEANEMPHGTASNLSYDDSKKINDIRIK